MFARLILFFLAAVTIVFLALGFVEDRSYAPFAIPFFLGLAFVYVMSRKLSNCTLFHLTNAEISRICRFEGLLFSQR